MDDAKFMVAGIQAKVDSTWNYEPQLKHLEMFLGDNMPPKGFNVVDFGCGIGRIARTLAQYGCTVTAIDVSTEMLSYAKEYCKDYAEVVEFHLSDGHGCDGVDDEWADLIVTQFVFQHMPSMQVIFDNLSDFHRVLKKGGRAVIQTNKRGTEDESQPACYQGVNTSPKEFSRVAESAGLTVVELNDPYGNLEDEWFRIVLEK